jgi:hypothetical protein
VGSGGGGGGEVKCGGGGVVGWVVVGMGCWLRVLMVIFFPFFF